MEDNLYLASSVPAEESVIGSMLVDSACIPAVMSRMSLSDLTDGTCRETFRVIQKLFVSGRPADPVTVVDAMQGGDVYQKWMADVMMATPTAANVDAYIDIAQKGAVLRRLRECADKLLICGDVDEAKELVRKMSAAMSATSKMPRMTAEELAKDFIARMSSKEKPDYLPWGFPTLDRLLHSELGDFNILGGYPSAGKTLISIQMALAMAKRYRVGYYSLETKPEKMADRLFSHLSGVPMPRIKQRTISLRDWPKLATATSDFNEHYPFDIIRAAGSTVDDVAADAVANRYQVIFIDYMQLLKIPGIKSGDRYSLVTAISSELHLFAQQNNVAIIALSQLARPEKTKEGKIPPDLHSLRESGQIEQDADSVIILYASDQNDNKSNRIVKIAKNKDGPRDTIEVVFDGATQTMAEFGEAREHSPQGFEKNEQVALTEFSDDATDSGYNPWEVQDEQP